MPEDFKYFKNEYFDDIQENYFKPILDDVMQNYGSTIHKVGDVGCGNGIFTAYLKKERDVVLYGVDASEHALKCAAESGFDKVILNNDLSSNKLAIEDNYFDFVLNKDVLEHLLDPEFLLKEIKRVLKPNGLFLLHIPNDFNLWKRIKFVFTHNIDTYGHGEKRCPGAYEWNWPHIRFLTFKGIKKLLEIHDFKIMKNYSSFFTDTVPVFYRMPGCMRLAKILADKYPSQFSQGITVLVENIKNQ